MKKIAEPECRHRNRMNAWLCATKKFLASEPRHAVEDHKAAIAGLEQACRVSKMMVAMCKGNPIKVLLIAKRPSSPIMEMDDEAFYREQDRRIGLFLRESLCKGDILFYPAFTNGVILPPYKGARALEPIMQVLLERKISVMSNSMTTEAQKCSGRDYMTYVELISAAQKDPMALEKVAKRILWRNQGYEKLVVDDKNYGILPSLQKYDRVFQVLKVMNIVTRGVTGPLERKGVGYAVVMYSKGDS